MDEKNVRKALDFLISEYRFEYRCLDFTGCPFGNWRTETYNYYNANGCFTITNLLGRDDFAFLRFDDITCVDRYSVWRPSIDLAEEEPEIWEKHKKRSLFRGFFWGERKILQILAEVIRTQIEERGAFFGIEVEKSFTHD